MTEMREREREGYKEKCCSVIVGKMDKKCYTNIIACIYSKTENYLLQCAGMQKV